MVVLPDLSRSTKMRRVSHVDETATPGVSPKTLVQTEQSPLPGLGWNHESAPVRASVGACLRHLAPDGRGSKMPLYPPVESHPCFGPGPFVSALRYWPPTCYRQGMRRICSSLCRVVSQRGWKVQIDAQKYVRLKAPVSLLPQLFQPRSSDRMHYRNP